MKKTRSARTNKKVIMPEKAKNVLKSVVLGPIVPIVLIVAIYFIWWAFSAVFDVFGGWVNSTFLPWMKEFWPVALGIWLFVLATSIVYAIFASTEKKKKVQSEEEVNETGENSEEIEVVTLPESENSNSEEGVSSGSENPPFDFEEFFSKIKDSGKPSETSAETTAEGTNS